MTLLEIGDFDRANYRLLKFKGYNSINLALLSVKNYV